jgi:hypothetical protein
LQGVAVAVVEPGAHQKPAGHWPEQLDRERPAVAPNVPAGQAVGAALPLAQKDPTGHTTAVAETEPGGHEKPAAHGPLQAGLERPVALPKVPPGHGTAVAEPCGQYEPRGQGAAEAAVAPAPHVKPAGHRPPHSAVEAPGPEPIVPGGQGEHDDAPASEKVPAAHCVPEAEAEPCGQAEPAAHAPLQPGADRPLALPKEPAGQGVGAELPAAQKLPTGHVVQGEEVAQAGDCTIHAATFEPAPLITLE